LYVFLICYSTVCYNISKLNIFARFLISVIVLFLVLRKYLNSIKIVQFAPQVIIDTSYVKWRDNEHFCCKTQIKYISFRTCVKVSIICPLGKINNLSNCQSWTITLHSGLLCLHNSKSKAGSSLT
jgi:hypothetical protein